MALVRTDVSEERIVSIIRAERICDVNVVPSSLILSIFMVEAIRSPQNVGSYKSHTTSHPRRRYSS
jgi:hypothetical protein